MDGLNERNERLPTHFDSLTKKYTLAMTTIKILVCVCKKLVAAKRLVPLVCLASTVILCVLVF